MGQSASGAVKRPQNFIIYVLFLTSTLKKKKLKYNKKTMQRIVVTSEALSQPQRHFGASIIKYKNA